MGMFDYVKINGHLGQVKCWTNSLFTINEGAEVGPLFDEWNYSIAMREGGFLNIKEGVLYSWTEKPEEDALFNKNGDRIILPLPKKYYYEEWKVF